jgi:hypothetical protein
MQTKVAPSVDSSKPVVVGFGCDPANGMQDLGAQLAVTLPATGFSNMAPVAPGISNAIVIPTASLSSGARVVIVADFVDSGSGTLTIDQDGVRLFSDKTSQDIVYLSMVI